MTDVWLAPAVTGSYLPTGQHTLEDLCDDLPVTQHLDIGVVHLVVVVDCGRVLPGAFPQAQPGNT